MAGAFEKFNSDEEEMPEEEAPMEEPTEAPEEEKKDMAMSNVTLAPETVDAIAASIVEKLGALQPGGPEPTPAEGEDGELQIV